MTKSISNKLKIISKLYKTMATAETAQNGVPPYEIIDIGANLTNHRFKSNEIDQIVQRCKDAGLVKIILTGTSTKISQESLELARRYPEYFCCTAGVHPHDAKHFTDECLSEITRIAADPLCVAIGECGLDFNRNFSPQDVQLRVFETQVKLACELQKPLFIHEREASSSMVEILTKYKANLPPTVIHCFTGTVDEAKVYLDMGFYIGLTGFLWKDKLPDGVQFGLKTKALPLNRILIETDAPFMYPKVDNKKLPIEVRQRISEHARKYLKFCSFDRNEPCSLAATCELIAAFVDVAPGEVAKVTTENARKVFGL